jgi:hypothetical protein
MPQPHTVTLNYDATNAALPFGPNPRQVAVKPNDTIQFQIGASTIAGNQGCKLRITLHQGKHFSRGVVQHAPGQSSADPLVVTVLPELATALAALLAHPHPVISGYKCELLDANGVAIPGLVSDGTDGGEVVPDTA